MVSNGSGDDWHSTQNAAYLQLLESRLSEPRLRWVDQFVQIINRSLADGVLNGQLPVSINDYGCNVGHFFRGVDDINCVVDYRGFDISDTYLSIARKIFGYQQFRYLDIEKESTGASWPRSNVAIISATLEHIENYRYALRNIFSQTESLVVLRTFVGSSSMKDKCRTAGAVADFLIRQFTTDQLAQIAVDLGWKYQLEIDQATMGRTKMVCNEDSVPRAQAVLVFTHS